MDQSPNDTNKNHSSNDSIIELDQSILNIQKVEIAFDQEYEAMFNNNLEELTDNEIEETTLHYQKNEMDAYWNKKLTEFNQIMENKTKEMNSKHSDNIPDDSPPTTLSSIRERIKQDINVYYEQKQTEIKTSITVAINQIELAKDKVKATIEEEYNTKLDEMDTKIKVNNETMKDILATTNADMKQNIEDFNKEITNQRDLNADITNSVIENIDEKMEQKISEYIENNSATTTRIQQEDVNTWKKMPQELSNAHQQLVRTNAVVIKNNKMLKTRLHDAEINFLEQSQKIAKQIDIVDSKEEKLRNIITALKAVENDSTNEITASIKSKWETLMMDITKSKINEIKEMMHNETTNTIELQVD